MVCRVETQGVIYLYQMRVRWVRIHRICACNICTTCIVFCRFLVVCEQRVRGFSVCSAATKTMYVFTTTTYATPTSCAYLLSEKSEKEQNSKVINKNKSNFYFKIISSIYCCVYYKNKTNKYLSLDIMSYTHKLKNIFLFCYL